MHAAFDNTQLNLEAGGCRANKPAYRHYKGGIYTYVTDATLEWARDTQVVIYEDTEGKRWVRPHSEFFGTVEHEGRTVPRFEQVAA